MPLDNQCRHEHNDGVSTQRASRRDREATVAKLTPRYLDGSLSTDTFEARVALAYSAQTRTALRALLADLPGLRRRAADAVARTRAIFLRRAPIELRLLDTVPQRELTLGRAPDCNFVVDDPTVSRRHAVLRRDGDGWTFRDTGSTNGSAVNGWHVSEARLRPGDELCLGARRIIVRD